MKQGNPYNEVLNLKKKYLFDIKRKLPELFKKIRGIINKKAWNWIKKGDNTKQETIATIQVLNKGLGFVMVTKLICYYCNRIRHLTIKFIERNDKKNIFILWF